MRKPGRAAARARPAQHGTFERCDRPGVRAGVRSHSQQGMLEQRQQGRRFEPSQPRFCDEAREDSGRRVGERIATGIVDLDLPAFEGGHHAAGQCAVGCHKRSGLARRLDRFTQTNRDRQGFLFRVGGFGDADAGHCLVRGGGEFGVLQAGLPAIRGRGRSQRFRRQHLTPVRGRAGELLHGIA